MATFKKCTHFMYKTLHYLMSLIVLSLVLSTVGYLLLFVSKQILHGVWNPDSSVLWRFLLNSVLLVLFIVQHSLMATPWFKRKLAYWFNVTVSERLLYVTATCLCLMVVINSWQSIPEVFLWLIDTQERSLLWTFFLILHCLCWLLLGLEVLLMDAGEMIGIHQVYRYHASQPSSLLMEKTLKLCEIYSGMRHPGVVMLTFMLWVHPLMTLDRVLLASVLTTYMVGRPNLDDSHYEFAKKYFREEHEEYRSSSSVRYEYVKEN